MKDCIKRERMDTQGQSLMEYALVAAVISAAILVMSTYVFRSVQATQQMIQSEAQRDGYPN